jgi:hypothetical protein
VVLVVVVLERAEFISIIASESGKVVEAVSVVEVVSIDEVAVVEEGYSESSN